MGDYRFSWDDGSVDIRLDRLVADLIFRMWLIEKHVMIFLFVLRGNIVQTAGHLITAIELNILGIKYAHWFARYWNLVHYLRVIDAGLALLFHHHFVHQLTHLSKLRGWTLLLLFFNILLLLLTKVLNSIWCLRKSQFFFCLLVIYMLLLILIAILGEKQLLMIASYSHITNIIVNYQWVLYEFVLKTIVGIDKPVKMWWSYLRVQRKMGMIT